MSTAQFRNMSFKNTKLNFQINVDNKNFKIQNAFQNMQQIWP